MFSVGDLPCLFFIYNHGTELFVFHCKALNTGNSHTSYFCNKTCRLRMLVNHEHLATSFTTNNITLQINAITLLLLV